MSTLIAQRQGAAREAIAPLKLHSGTVEGLKWLALASMTVDHIGKHLLDGAPWAFGVGRLALPLFFFVLAYNLSREDRGDVSKRSLYRLLAWGLASAPICIVLNGWLPLNIMFTFALFAGLMCLRGGGWFSAAAGIVLFCAGGAFVEYWWPGLAFGFACAAYCRRPSGGRMAMMCIAALGLTVVMALLTVGGTRNAVLANMNFWTLAALPVIFLARDAVISIPRLRLVFYAYYPAHLAVLWAIKTYF